MNRKGSGMNAKLISLALACTPLLAAAEPTAGSSTTAGILKSGVYLQNLDKSVRPQDDFYRHINGGWLTNTPVSYTHLTLPTILLV